MTTKPGPKNWDDIKMMLTAISITATLGFWNVFAAANEQNTVKTVTDQTPPTAPVVEKAVTNPVPAFSGKILLGGKAPSQTVITVRAKAAAPSNNNQQPAPVTQTRSS